MTVAVLKPTVIVNAGLGLLVRESVLANMVWKNAAGDFAGALDDTITIRVPIYTKARRRALRSGDTRQRDNLSEHGVDVSLTTDIYKDLKITDEELTLDISDFGSQVLNPSMASLAREIETVVIEEFQGADYPVERVIEFDYGSDDAWKDLVLRARRYLNDARVPMEGRTLAVGSGIEEALLGTDLFVKANESGGTTALREATIDRKAGFTIVGVPGLDPDEAYAFHRSAVVLSQRAPVVPAGAPYGASSSYGGFAMRVVRVLDPNTIEDILALDTWTGSNFVTDVGVLDGNGVFEPAEDPEDSGAEELFVRAVQITASSS